MRRAQGIVGHGGQYLLGTGDYQPIVSGHLVLDYPWTYQGNSQGSDCAGFAICWAWKLKRHRPGFNQGAWASVSDDINCNSAIEDGAHRQELFTLVHADSAVMPGDLLAYPTFRVPDHAHNLLTFIGHVGLVESVPGNFKYGDWKSLGILQCHGPNYRSPGVVRTDGQIWATHDSIWPKPEHRTQVVRPRTH